MVRAFSILSILFSFTSVLAIAQTDTTQQITPGRHNSKLQQQKPYVILISADGFRYDYAKKYHAEHLLQLSGSGAKAAAMIPSYPSITFPNHYTLVTGLYPAHHGLVGNQFYDPALGRSYSYKGHTVTEAVWYGGTPLWTLAEQQQMLSASFYWVGSEAPEKGLLPTYYYHYNEKINIHDRIATIQQWLTLPAEERPHLITVYFPEVDHAGHKYGPDAPETAKAVRFIDSAVYELTKAVKSTGLKVNYVFVSDHGMTRIPTTGAIETPAVIDTNRFIISGESVIVNVYSKKKDQQDIARVYHQLKKEAVNYSVYLKNTVPAYLHYGSIDDRYGRIGDIVLIPHYPHVFKLNSKHTDPGCHGYDPRQVKDMQATFYAWGPGIKKGVQIPAFSNVNVFPVVARLLGLNYNATAIDGKPAVAKAILR